jgi:hypothetical protein
MAKFRFLMAAALFGFSAIASAALIQGDITFGGNVTSVNKVTNFVDITGNQALVTGVNGDFTTSISFGDTATYNDFNYDPLSGTTPLWTAGTFSFDLTNITSINENPGAGGVLSLAGLGTMSSAGYDDTLFAWSFSADSAGGGVFAFSSTNIPVPEPGILLLLSTGLLGLGISRRYMNKA